MRRGLTAVIMALGAIAPSAGRAASIEGTIDCGSCTLFAGVMAATDAVGEDGIAAVIGPPGPFVLQVPAELGAVRPETAAPSGARARR